jgi:hypothetical protein
VEAEVRLYDRAYIAGAQGLDRTLEHDRLLAFVVSVQPALLRVRSVRV